MYWLTWVAAINDQKATIDYDTFPVISGYPTEIKELFQNLIINSIKFRKKNTEKELLLVVRIY